MTHWFQHGAFLVSYSNDQFHIYCEFPLYINFCLYWSRMKPFLPSLQPADLSDLKKGPFALKIIITFHWIKAKEFMRLRRSKSALFQSNKFSLLVQQEWWSSCFKKIDCNNVWKKSIERNQLVLYTTCSICRHQQFFCI